MRQILVAVDGSEPSDRALQAALEWARTNGAELLLASVVAPPPTYGTGLGSVPIPVDLEDNAEYYRKLLERETERARGAGVAAVRSAVLRGPVAETLLDFAEKEGVELIVLGARGLSPARRFLLGSVSDAVVHHARSAVLIVH